MVAWLRMSPSLAKVMTSANLSGLPLRCSGFLPSYSARKRSTPSGAMISSKLKAGVRIDLLPTPAAPLSGGAGLVYAHAARRKETRMSLTVGQDADLAQDEVAANLLAIRERIAAAARSVDRDPAAVTLVAASKAQPEARIERSARGRPAHLRRELRPGGGGALALAARALPGPAAAHDRSGPDQQGEGGGGLVRCDRDPGPAAARAGARQGDGPAGAPSALLRPGQHRRGGEQGGRGAGGDRCLRRRMPRRSGSMSSG